MNVRYSVIIPAFNEALALPELIKEIDHVFTTHYPNTYEIICVDDASTDNTLQVLQNLQSTTPTLRVFLHERRSDKSTAVRTAILNALGNTIITVDGDGQDDPSNITKLIKIYNESTHSFVFGIRNGRRDSFVKKFSSRVANTVRQLLLKDGVSDTGCGLKVMERNIFMRLPFFHNSHRYIPALVKREGYTYVTVPVSHRERKYGYSKYGTIDRLLAGLCDLVAVRWLMWRFKNPGNIKELPSNLCHTTEKKRVYHIGS